MDSQSFQQYNYSGSNAMGSTDADSHAGENSARNGSADHERRDHSSSDVSTSALFAADAKRHDELKRALDPMQRDTIKLDAMRRVMALVAAGQDCSDLFSIIVKNVVTKDSELKKLVFMYIVRYAEQQQDLVLLSISTFQRALKDPNQLIRAHALRVLSSIRVSIIVPIMMLAIKDAANDMSPYVRRTAAHSIPKLYHIDPEQLDQLLQVIEKLLGDKSTIVVGSAAQAFMEVCPDRLDLLHKNFRKLCNLLIDVDEWGQVVLVNLLMRYCRNQFADPNQIDPAAEERATSKFYSDEDSSSSSASSTGDDDDEDEEKEKKAKKKKKKSGAQSTPSKSSGARVMDSDHRLLLRSCRPLLNARSPAVVMAVVQLFMFCAPRSELELNNGGVFRALFRLLRGSREVQYAVLHTLASVSVDRERVLLEPHLRALFVHPNNPTSIKLLKLEILTNLANERNVSTVLRELDAYVASSDKQLAAAAVEAIGRVACALPQVSDACLGGLVQLLSLQDENLVAEAVVVIKKLLQTQAAEHKEVVVQLARLLDTIAVPMARASILWLIGEYVDCVPKLAPDILRRSAKQFIECEDIVKLQILNLAAKLLLTNAKQTRLLVQYVLTLARYDQNYDIRDRARFLTHLLLPPAAASSSSAAGVASEQQQQPPHHLHRYLKRIFFAPKPAPVLESTFKNRNGFLLGTLSSLSSVNCAGYEPLADWPVSPPDPSVRNVPEPSPTSHGASSLHTVSPQHARSDDADAGAQDDKPFYSDEEAAAEEVKSGEEEEEQEDEEEDDKEEEKDEESEKASDESEGERPARTKASKSKGHEENGSDEEEKSGSEPQSESEESSSEDETQNKGKPAPAGKERAAPAASKSGTTRPAPSNKAPSRTNKSESDEESESGSEVDEAEEEDQKASSSAVAANKSQKPASTAANAASRKAPTADMLLLDFDVDSTAAAPALTPSASLSGALTPSTSQPKVSAAATSTPPAQVSMIAPPATITSRSFELISKSSSGGLVSATYRFTRNVSAYSSTMTAVELAFVNQSESSIGSIKLASKRLTGGMTLQEFAEVTRLAPRATTSSLLAVDFKDCAQPAQFDVLLAVDQASSPAAAASSSGAAQQARTVSCSVRAPIGEQLRPHSIGEAEFTLQQAKLRGLNEQSESLSLADRKRVEVSSLLSALYAAAHVGPVSYSSSPSASTSDSSTATAGVEWVARFAARTISESHLVLLVLTCTPSALRISVHCEKMMLVSLIARELKQALADALRSTTSS